MHDTSSLLKADTLSVEEALNLLELILPAGSVNAVKSQVFQGAWQGQSYLEMSHTFGYEVSYLKLVGFQLWRDLSQALGRSVSKSNIRATLRQVAQQAVGANQNLTGELSSDLSLLQDWEEKVDVSHFYGYGEELAKLRHWVVQDRCRLVLIWGLVGSGKTAIASKLAQDLTVAIPEGAPRLFDVVIWRSLRSRPTLRELLTELLAIYGKQWDGKVTIGRLLHQMRLSRSLIVLDGVEAVLSPDSFVDSSSVNGAWNGAWNGARNGDRSDYNNYREFFQVLTQNTHQSCVILTSREKLVEIAALEGTTLPVRSLQIGGCPDAGLALIRSRELMGIATHQHHLSHLYGHHPLAIQIVAAHIRDMFDGDIALFLKQQWTLFRHLRYLLEPQIQALPSLGKQVVQQLAVHNEWVSPSMFESFTENEPTNQEMLDVFEILVRRSLVERKLERYRLHPLIRQYVMTLPLPTGSIELRGMKST